MTIDESGWGDWGARSRRSEGPTDPVAAHPSAARLTGPLAMAGARFARRGAAPLAVDACDGLSLSLPLPQLAQLPLLPCRLSLWGSRPSAGYSPGTG